MHERSADISVRTGDLSAHIEDTSVRTDVTIRLEEVYEDTLLSEHSLGDVHDRLIKWKEGMEVMKSELEEKKIVVDCISRGLKNKVIIRKNEKEHENEKEIGLEGEMESEMIDNETWQEVREDDNENGSNNNNNNNNYDQYGNNHSYSGFPNYY